MFATRALEGAFSDRVFWERSNGFSGGFFPVRVGFGSHLEVYSMCRKELEKLIEFFGYYQEALENADIDKKFDALTGNISLRSAVHEESVPEGVKLFYEPYNKPFAEKQSWAAATSQPEKELVRFCSKDGRFVLREFFDFASGKKLFYLVGSRGFRVENVEVVIDGKSLMPGENGLLDIDVEGMDITKDSNILLKGDFLN